MKLAFIYHVHIYVYTLQVHTPTLVNAHIVKVKDLKLESKVKIEVIMLYHKEYIINCI